MDFLGLSFGRFCGFRPTAAMYLRRAVAVTAILMEAG